MDIPQSRTLSVEINEKINNSQNNLLLSQIESPCNNATNRSRSNSPLCKRENQTINQREDNEYVNLKKFNKRALSRVSNTYELETFPKKLMIIFNQVNVDGRHRVGTEKDVKAFTETFGKFGFTIQELRDKTQSEILSKLDSLANDDFTEYGCLAVVFLTCLSKIGALGAKDEEPYTEKDIIQRLKASRNETLITKPKIVLIQTSTYTETTSDSGEINERVYHDNSVDSDEFYTLPVESDMLVIHSSYEGKSSYNPINGCWFIQNLCSKVDHLADKEDLESILVMMKRSVDIDRKDDDQNAQNNTRNKKMPVITSTLIRKLYLKDYQGVSPMASPRDISGDFYTQRVRSPEQTLRQLDTSQ